MRVELSFLHECQSAKNGDPPSGRPPHHGGTDDVVNRRIGPGAVTAGPNRSSNLDELLAGLHDWRGTCLAEVRRLIHQAVPDVEDQWKWMGSPVWAKDGIIAVGNAHKHKVKLTFPQGAHLDDPHGVFNNGLGGKAWRAIDIAEGDRLNVTQFKALVRRAARYNAEHAKRTRPRQA